MCLRFPLPQSKQQQADEGQAAVFKWSDAFAQLNSREEGLFLHILGYLSKHPCELRNFAETCKSWNRSSPPRHIQFAPLVSGRVFLREIIRAIVHCVKCVLMCAPREGPSVRGSSEKCDLDRLASAGVNT